MQWAGDLYPSLLLGIRDEVFWASGLKDYLRRECVSSGAPFSVWTVAVLPVHGRQCLCSVAPAEEKVPKNIVHW